MNKKIKPYIIILSLLIAFIIIAQFLPAGKSRIVDLVKFNNQYSMQALRDFNVRDTASITKIFMADKNNRTVSLERKGAQWLANNEFIVRYDGIKILLETLHTMRVKMPVAISAREEIFRKMAGRSIKVEVYSGSKKIKTLYVGGVTQDNLGTYMLLENSDVPFVIEIPGFRGYLSSRFSTDVKNWRNHVLIGEKPDLIKQIEIQYADKQNGFKVIQTAPRKYELYNAQGVKAAKFDSLLVKGFFEQFEIANFDRFVDLFGPEVKDSLRKTTPLFSIHLLDVRDSVQNYYFYKVPEISEEDDPDRHLYPQSLWVFNNSNEWMLVQTYTYLLMFREFSDFKPAL